MERMAKFSRIPKLSKKERQELLIALCEALSSIKNKEEAAKFLADLLSPQELEMIAKRLEIARLLIDGETYEVISGKLKVGFSTIARVNAWLTLSGEGFRLIIKRNPKRKEKNSEEKWNEENDPYSLYNIKRRYSMYFLPELIIDEIMKRSNAKQKNQLVSILQSMDSKSEIFKQVNERFRAQFKRIKRKAIST